MDLLTNILMSDDIVKSIRENLDYILSIIPELNKIINYDHENPHHHLDIFEHTLLALSMSEKDLLVRLSLLLHDIGKPASAVVDDKGIKHYPNHPLISSSMADEILTRINCDEETKDKVVYLVKYHDTAITEKDILNNRELSLTRLKIQKCDTLAHTPSECKVRQQYIDKTLRLF